VRRLQIDRNRLSARSPHHARLIPRLRRLAFRAFALGWFAVHADPVLVAFLDDADALRSTTELLLRHGTPHAAIADLEKAITQYKSTPPGFDFDRLPPKVNGFYTFESAGKATGALPHALYKADHPYELNCFHAVVLLTSGRLNVEASPDAPVGPIIAPLPQKTPDEVLTFFPAATLRDASEGSTPAWYAESIRPFMNSVPRDRQICLVAGIYRSHLLPKAAEVGDSGPLAFATLKAAWKNLGLTFPRGS
jgi:hypothetical protein